MADRIEFRVNKKKVIEGLVLLAQRSPRIDVFHACKVFFYADRAHLRQYGRPIFGDRYVAMDAGPVPSFTLSLIKGQIDFAGAHWVEEFAKRVRTDDTDDYARLIARSDFDDSQFSRTDLECLNDAIAAYADMPFKQLWRQVHREPEYVDVYREGTSTPMPVESMIPANVPDRESVIEYLQETAHVTDI